MPNQIIHDLFKGPNQAFQTHLEIPFNERIIFSGIYGIGKTTFLKHFFETDYGKETYNVFHLFPVNYSILENEDVFSYLKYDILYELIVTHNFEFQDEHFEFFLTLPFFIKQTALHFFTSFLLLIPKMGKQLFQFSEEMKKLKDQFQKLQSGGDKNEADAVDNFFKSFHKKEGGAYENNFITQLIVQALEELKINEKDSKKKNILIIDDLDRIDPHHVFRLFNVFAAHFDQRNEQEKNNKFGFDQVVFVCDLENVRGLFRSQYGADIDFNGYIDKFYSRRIFKFDNTSDILKIIDSLFSKEFIPTYQHLPYQPYKEAVADLKFIFKVLVSLDLVNLRILLRFVNEKPEPALGKIIFHSKGEAIFLVQLRSMIVVHILLQFFGDYNYLYETISKCADNYVYSEKLLDREILLKRMIPDLIIPLHEKLSKIPWGIHNPDELFSFKFEGYEFLLTYRRTPGSNDIFGIIDKVIDSDNQEIGITEINYFKLFKEFLEKLRSNGLQNLLT